MEFRLLRFTSSSTGRYIPCVTGNMTAEQDITNRGAQRGAMPPGELKRRAYLRKEFALGRKILVNEHREARLKNMSLGGMCFHSEDAHDVGNEIIVGNRLMSIFAKVLACRPDTVQNGHGPIAGHEVRCEYVATTGLLQQEMLMELVLGEENTTTV